VLSAVLIDGQRAAVRWTDGDSFHVDSGPLRGRSVRLADVNALEAYGPVHRIGTLSPSALFELARASAGVAASGQWSCSSLGRRDVYGRTLVRCPEAAAALVRSGHAMVFAVEGRADEALLELQREAQAAGRGLWAGGVPPRLLSSLHSVGERGVDQRGAYDRHVDTATGAARPVRHRRTYALCQEVCLEGPLASCLRYVPVRQRYRRWPPCAEEARAQPPGRGPSSGRQ
jgi:endonuclease YncB( thermonuclease family)